jgi:hypothetical protein
LFVATVRMAEDLTTSFKTLSINSDWSNRRPQAKGTKLFTCVGRIVEAEKPDHVVVEEIGPRNARNVIKACEGYKGVVLSVDYDEILLMWDDAKWKLLATRHMGVLANSGAVFLQNRETEVKVWSIGTLAY